MLRERPFHRTRSARSSALLLSNPHTTSAYLGWLYSGATQVMQATLGDEVMLIPPGVSRTLVPLDCVLVLQIVYGVVVALTVRSDTGAFSRFEKGEVGSW